MKKLFAIAIAASALGGLYGFSLGLGVAYDQLAVDSLYGKAHLAIKADVMCKPMPILGFRIGLVSFNMIDSLYGGTQWWVATGGEAGVLFYIPMAGMIQPYIPVFLMYKDQGDLGGTVMHLMGGLGAEMGFGTVTGYLEGKFEMLDVGEFEGFDPESQSWFDVQGGVRIPLGM